MFMDTYGAMWKLVYEQLIGTIASLTRSWEPEELPADGGTDTTKLVKRPSTGEKYVSLRADWSTEYITTGLGDVGDCNRGKVENEGRFTLPKKSTLLSCTAEANV